MDATQTHTLNYPVTHQGREYTELSARRPKAKDVLRAVKKGGEPLEADMEQLVHLCEVPRQVIDELDITDLHAMQDVLRSFANPTEADLRKAIITLSIQAGWDLSTIEELTVEEITEWLKTLDAIRPQG